MNSVYCIMILICILTMITMCFHVKSKIFLSKQTKMWFIITFIGISFGMMSEFLRSLIEFYSLSPTLYKFITLAEFCITPIMPIPLSLACNFKKSAYATGILLLLHTVVEIILVNTGMVFYLDNNGTYHRGDYYIIYILAYIISLLYLMLTFVMLSKKFQRRNLGTLIASVVIIFAGIIPSLIDRDTKTAFLGMTFMSIVLYCYYEGLTQQDIANDLVTQNTRIKNMQIRTIIGIANLIGSRDTNTGAHVKNTSYYVDILAQAALEAGVYPEIIDNHFIEIIRIAAPLHDIGKIAVPDYVLLKPGKFTDEEFEIMKTHASEGGKMILQILDENVDSEYTKIATEVATYHHEKWNGKGYPCGLSGNDIPVSARIMAIADVYDALTMERVYKKAFPPEKALEIIENDTGIHFDPVLAPIFVKVMREKLTEQQ